MRTDGSSASWVPDGRWERREPVTIELRGRGKSDKGRSEENQAREDGWKAAVWKRNTGKHVERFPSRRPGPAARNHPNTFSTLSSFAPKVEKALVLTL
jgi:hypothetical protein